MQKTVFEFQQKWLCERADRNLHITRDRESILNIEKYIIRPHYHMRFFFSWSLRIFR